VSVSEGGREAGQNAQFAGNGPRADSVHLVEKLPADCRNKAKLLHAATFCVIACSVYRQLTQLVELVIGSCKLHRELPVELIEHSNIELKVCRATYGTRLGDLKSENWFLFSLFSNFRPPSGIA